MGKKLLVADDSVTIQKVIKLALSSEGYDILAVSDGKEAIRAIEQERPDVVLIDVALPGADAYQVKKTINADSKLASIGFILLASAFERVDEKQVDEVGFQGRLIKPFDPSHLRKAVADLMGKDSAGPSGPVPSVPQKPSFAAPPPPPPPPAPPASVTELETSDDLPPVKDMHPTVEETEAPPSVTEADLNLGAHEPTLVMQPPIAPPIETPVQAEASTSVIEPPIAPPIAPPVEPPAAPLSEEAEEADATRALENDIKDLTESTIKLSGLDEFQWNLDDSRKMKSPGAPPAKPPTPPPPSQTTEYSATDRTVEIQRPNKEGSLKNVITIPSKPIDDGGSNFPLKPGTAAQAPQQPRQPSMQGPTPEAIPEPTREIFVPPPAPTIPQYEPPASETSYSAPSSPASAAAPAMTRAEIEELIRKDVAAVIERLAREIIPQVAEDIIRKEIEKILAEP